MKRFNLSEWAITHRPLVLFMILLLGAAGAYSYFNLGRAEDPSFTIKVMVVNVAWPGATADRDAGAGRRQDREEAAGAALSRPGRELFAARRLVHPRASSATSTPPAKVKDLWYQVRKKVGDIRGDLPAGIIGPNFNDEYGDVYSALYMLTADGLTPRRAQGARRGHPPAPAARARRQQGRHHRRAAGADLHRVQPRQARDARRSRRSRSSTASPGRTPSSPAARSTPRPTASICA